MRAENFDIPKGDRSTVIQSVAKILPAVVTSTSVAAGWMVFEMIKSLFVR